MLGSLGSAASWAAPSTPDADRVAEINRETLGAPAIRITTTSGRSYPAYLQATRAGVQFIATDSTSGSQPSLVPWSSILRIDVRGGHTTAGAVLGSLAGFAAMGALVSAQTRGGDDLSVESGFVILAAGTAGGALAGGFAGSQLHSWARIYPWYERNGVIVSR